MAVIGKSDVDMHKDFLALFDNPAALFDLEGRLVSCDEKFSRKLGDSFDPDEKPQLSTFLNRTDLASFERFATNSKTVLPLTLRLSSVQHEGELKRVPQIYPLEGYVCQLKKDRSLEELRLDYLMNHLEQGIWDYDAKAQEFDVSEAWLTMRGLDPNDKKQAGKPNWLELVHPDDRERLRDHFEGQTRGEKRSIDIQYRRKHTDGRWIWVLCRSQVVDTDENGMPNRIIGTDMDITSMKEQDLKITEIATKLQLAIEASGMGIWEFDPVTESVHWDDRMLEIYGLTDGQNYRSENLWETYLHPDDIEEMTIYSDHCQKHGLDFRSDYRIVRADGEVRYVRSMARNLPVDEASGKLVGVNFDVTADYERSEQLEKARAQLEYDSRHDALTGLANRRLLEETTTNLFEHMTPEQNFAVMHLDLDKFKQINDTLGHGAGDAVLTHVATVIDRQIGELGLTCRVGGDEFVVLFETAPSTKMAEKICSEIISTLEEPFHHDGHTCRFSVSIGYATGAGDCDEKMDVFGHADAALYAAKEAGRGCFRFHGHTTTPNFLSEADERQRLLDAIASGELTCHYQPQFHAVSGDLVGAEALVRWKCPQRGLLRPDAFMPTVEKFELEGMVDGHVFDLVARSQTLWAKSGAPQLPISMNISRQRFQCRKMLDHVSSNLKKHHRIHFELLETAFWDKLNDRDMQTLETLRQLGIGIELDDFGSGHASIAAMQAVQPDRIKIDGKLVVPITSNSEQILVLKLVTKLARLQKVGVVVEGVETLEHLKMVKDLDCDVLQGYALGMPMEADEFFCLLMGAPASQAQLRANG